MPASNTSVSPFGPAPAAGSMETLAQSVRRCYALHIERVQRECHALCLWERARGRVGSMAQAVVCIVMGSANDWPIMQGAAEMLARFHIPYEVTVSSAHRAPQRTAALAHDADQRGVQVLIAGAGGAAALAGVIAAETTLPVIGVPIDSSSLQGLDALLATVQMPQGVPVATVAIGKAGAANAGILAAQILALQDPELAVRLRQYKAELAAGVERADATLQAQLQGQRDGSPASR